MSNVSRCVNPLSRFSRRIIHYIFIVFTYTKKKKKKGKTKIVNADNGCVTPTKQRIVSLRMNSMRFSLMILTEVLN